MDFGMEWLVGIALGVAGLAAVLRWLRLWRMQRMARAYIYLAALAKGRSAARANAEAKTVTLQAAVLAADEVDEFVRVVFLEDERLMLRTAREKGLTY